MGYFINNNSQNSKLKDDKISLRRLTMWHSDKIIFSCHTAQFGLWLCDWIAISDFNSEFGSRLLIWSWRRSLAPSEFTVTCSRATVSRWDSFLPANSRGDQTTIPHVLTIAILRSMSVHRKNSSGISRIFRSHEATNRRLCRPRVTIQRWTFQLYWCAREYQVTCEPVCLLLCG